MNKTIMQLVSNPHCCFSSTCVTNFALMKSRDNESNWQIKIRLCALLMYFYLRISFFFLPSFYCYYWHGQLVMILVLVEVLGSSWCFDHWTSYEDNSKYSVLIMVHRAQFCLYVFWLKYISKFHLLLKNALMIIPCTFSLFFELQISYTLMAFINW